MMSTPMSRSYPGTWGMLLITGFCAIMIVRNALYYRKIKRKILYSQIDPEGTSTLAIMVVFFGFMIAAIASLLVHLMKHG